MPDDPVRAALDGIRTTLQRELDAQLAALVEQHEASLSAVRAEAEALAEQRWAARLEGMRAEWSSRLEAEVAAARLAAERRMVAESTRLRVEAEQAAAESTARLQQELETLSAERRQAEEANRVDRERAEAAEADRDRVEAALQTERDRTAQLEAAQREAETRFEREREAAVQALDRERREVEAASGEAHVAERQAWLGAVDRLLAGVAAIDRAGSLSETLDALASGAAAESPRAVLFIVNGDELQPWRASTLGGGPVQPLLLDEGGLLARAAERREPVACPGTADARPSHRPPSVMALPPNRAALAVPLCVGGRTVAVLYADDGEGAEPAVPAAWPEALQILGCVAAAVLARITAVRTAQALRLVQADSGHAGNSSPSLDAAPDEAGARRYARLLVSEIKLYNEPAVRAGREHRDIVRRLGPEIERARRLYEERVPPTVGSRSQYFHHELVQTLADGDPALLGGSV